MQKHVVHLYESLNSKTFEYESHDPNLFLLPSFPVVGIVSNNSYTKPSFKNLVQGLKLKPFEIVQDHFDLFISNAHVLGAQILSIEFMDDLEADLSEEIELTIQSQNYDKLMKLIKEVRDEHVDIFSISFNYKGLNQRMTKYAVAEVLGEVREIPDILMNSPLSIIAGFKSVSPSYHQ